jgi:hypothetical protein
LIDQQYAAGVIYLRARHAVAFDRWLAKRRIPLADLSEVHIERYQNRSRRPHRRIPTGTRQPRARQTGPARGLLLPQSRGGCCIGEIVTRVSLARGAERDGAVDIYSVVLIG